MAKALRNPPRKTYGTRNRRQRLFVVLGLLSALLLIVGLGIYLHRPTPSISAPTTHSTHRGGDASPAPGRRVETVDTEPPALDLAGADPAVIAAIEAARTAVRQSPRSAHAWGRLGMILSAHTFATEANACFGQAEQLDPREGRWPYYQGTELCLNEPDVAIAKLRRAVELFDSRLASSLTLRVGMVPTPTRSVSEETNRSIIARLRLGELLLRQGRLEEAEQEFRQVLHQDPDNARAHLNLARLARERGDWRASLAHLSRPSQDLSTRKASHLLAVEVYRRLGNDTAAEQERHQAAKLPKDADWPDPLVEQVMRLRTGKQARLAGAAQLLGEGRAREAAESLRQMVQDYPDSDWAWLLFGRALLGQNDWAAAERALRTAVKLAPASMEGHFYLGGVLLLQGNPQAAAACYRQAAAIKPDFAEAHHNLAHCLLRQGDRTGAIAAFREALSCKPHYVEAHLDLAEALAQEGVIEEALRHARHGVQLRPSNPKAMKLWEDLQKTKNDKETR